MRQDLKMLMVVVLLFFIRGVTAEEVPDGTIYGHVYDADTKQPLSQAFVYCQDTNCPKQTTDKDGYYTIAGCFSPSTSYIIKCTKFGYESSSKTVVTDKQGKAEESFSIKKATEKENSINAQSWISKGDDLNNQGNYEGAAEAYAKAIALNPSLENDQWFKIGFAFLMAKKYQESIDAYNKVLESDPSDTEALLWIGIALRDSGKKDEAIKYFDKVINENPHHSKAWNNKAICLMELGNQEEAIQCYDRAIEYAEDDSDASAYSDNKGNALFKMGRHEEALKAYDKAIELAPRYGNPQFDKIVALRKLGREDEANQLQNKYGCTTEDLEIWEKNWGS